MSEDIKPEDKDRVVDGLPRNEKKIYVCDRCGFTMIEKNCKVECPNCGNRFDCSDLNIYFD